MSQVPQYQAIYNAVCTFEMHNIPRQILFSYIAMIVQAMYSGTSKKAFITQILSQNFPSTFRIKIQDLMQHAFAIFDILPKAKQVVISKQNEVLINNSDDEGQNEAPPPPPPPPGPAKRISLSYIEVKVPLSQNPGVLIFNNVSRSVAIGSEGQTTEHMSESIRFISDLQIYMDTTFETLVRSDQTYRSMLYAGQSDGILYRSAVLELYGNYGREILAFPREVVEPVLKERCMSVISDVFSGRTHTEEKVDLMTNHVPKFDFSPTVSFSTQKSPIKFSFSARSTLVADLLHRIGTLHSKQLISFLDTMMPLFVITRTDERICIIGTDAISNALYLFSKCATAIDSFFGSALPEDPSLADIIRAAECEAANKYSPVTDTHIEEFLEDFLKKFFAFEYKFYELVEEAENRYGRASKALFTLTMYITQLDALCSRFAAQYKLSKFGTLAKFFSRAHGPHAKESLEARFPTYLKKSQNLLLSPLVKIEMSSDEPDAVITPI
ncbi:hypothetical protein TVAG_431880 [Trichomonas vaginalis G3]|uniref:Uncharacterized protein n=1 Tax=Trichomonas vaginalis (strain ATCC PRA-98 / G3) TaxID=412133 RepID=A2F7Y5_TRIV3|nr:hypothetical protein TVAGG3_0671570 [Trichomonas vaginalis G3]EAX98979.1 hypothetical protein TVAG_431880 [Trichomonas vaginalis G3]KAI5507235.1 hypothetical protein TVAGG3_0671570 [Trichomonas vaginalis G3]|eukprot:XP_001311909.1 hypothetical protein [Trichomonas vaginalis G3]